MFDEQATKPPIALAIPVYPLINPEYILVGRVRSSALKAGFARVGRYSFLGGKIDSNRDAELFNGHFSPECHMAVAAAFHELNEEMQDTIQVNKDSRKIFVLGSRTVGGDQDIHYVVFEALAPDLSKIHFAPPEEKSILYSLWMKVDRLPRVIHPGKIFPPLLSFLGLKENKAM